jgi:hypothetical protein
MPITLNGDTGITTPSYGGADPAEYVVPVTAFKNRIINGAMQIDQRNNGASVTATNSTKYVTDRFACFAGAPSGAGVFTAQQVTDAPSGFIKSLKATVTTADTTASADSQYFIAQYIEGLNVADLGFGTASSSAVTLSFWVKSSLTGTFAGGINNGDATRSYVFTYTINSANTWEQKTITIAGDTTGTWLTDNGIGLRVNFSLGSGSTFQNTPDSWIGAYDYATSGATRTIGTLNATWQVTGVQLEKGSTATSFDYRPYGTELALCQRYYYRVNGNGTTQTAMSFGGYSSATTLGVGFNQFPVTMRIAPTAMEQSGTAGHYAWRGAGSNVTFNGVPTWADVTTENIGAYTGSVASGLTAGQSIYTRALSSSAYFAWSAEL